MLNPNKRTKTKPKPKPTLIFKNCSHVCAYHCVQLSYTTQHRTVLIISPLIHQTIIIAQMMSTKGRGAQKLQMVDMYSVLHVILISKAYRYGTSFFWTHCIVMSFIHNCILTMFHVRFLGSPESEHTWGIFANTTATSNWHSQILKNEPHKQTPQLPHPHHNRFTALFPDHPGQPVPEKNFWTL